MLALLAGATAMVLAQLGPGGAVDTLGVLALAPPPGPPAELVEVTVQLRQDVAARRTGVLDAQQLRARMTGPAAASLAELDRAFQGARAAYVAGDHEGAVRTLRAVVDDLEKLPESAEAFGQWTRAVLRLAKSESDLGRPEAARALLERLARAAPDVEVDAALFPSRFLRQVEQARAGLRAEPTRVLKVVASAPGARVYVNGRDVGNAPVSLVVPRGWYRVSGTLATSRVLPFAVDLRDGDGEALLDFSIPEALRPALGPGLALPEEDRARLIVTAGGYLGLAEVVTVRLLEDGGGRFAVGALHDVRRGMLVREGRVRLGLELGSRALAEFLVSGTATSGLVEPLGDPGWLATPRPVPTEPVTLAPVPAEPPPASRTLGWLALGTGLATVGLAAFAVAETRSASASYDLARTLRGGGFTTYQQVVDYNRAVDHGDAARHDAAVGWACAGLGVLATGTLGYLNYRRTGEFGPFRF